MLLPVVVDFDSALLKTRRADEVILDTMRTLPSWGLALLSRAFGQPVPIQRDRHCGDNLDVSAWPVREDLLARLRTEAEGGRDIVLFTREDAPSAKAFVDRFPYLTRVFGPEAGIRWSAEEAAERLKAEFQAGYIFVGGQCADLPILAAAKGAILTDPDRAMFDIGREDGFFMGEYRSAGIGFDILRRTLRLHQWAKNGLVFVPLVLGGKAASPDAWMAAVFGFLALGLVASASYIINDLWDLPEDRKHWSKRLRPLASGEISIRLAGRLSAGALATGLGLGLYLGPLALTVLLLYLAITLSYSFGLKRVPLLDVLLLALLFTMRLGFGIAITGVRVSPWLLVFSMFVFLSLSLAKRHTEVLRMAERGLTSLHGRGYLGSDGPITLGLGLASMQGAILIFVLYLIEDAFSRGFYATPEILWFAPAILFLFLGRIWLLGQRDLLKDDPVAFALKDRTSLGLGLLMGIVFLAAMIRPPA